MDKMDQVLDLMGLNSLERERNESAQWQKMHFGGVRLPGANLGSTTYFTV